MISARVNDMLFVRGGHISVSGSGWRHKTINQCFSLMYINNRGEAIGVVGGQLGESVGG